MCGYMLLISVLQHSCGGKADQLFNTIHRQCKMTVDLVIHLE